MTRIFTIAATVWLEIIRKKDVYVLLVLLGALLGAVASLDVFGLGKVVAYVKDVGLLSVWLFGWILACTISSRELPQEEMRRTILSLLAKPISRIELIIGKWLGVYSIVSVSVLCAYLLVAGVVALRGGRFSYIPLLQGYILHCFALGVICAIGLALSTRMNSDAAVSLTYVLTGAAFLVVPRVPVFVARESGVASFGLMLAYHVLPHFEVFDMRKRLVHDYGHTPWVDFCVIALYAALITAAFLLIAWLAYRHKRFSRADLAG